MSQQNPPGDTSGYDSGWLPIADLADLVEERPLMPVSIDGKAYVLFRDEEGELGLIGRYCPHRGADLCYGRLEDNGIRCPFHGWHFDRTGQCLEQPAEPEGSRMAQAIKTPVLQVQERQGKIYAYVDGYIEATSEESSR